MPHIHDLIDFTVEVFIVYKNKVLLRKHDKYKHWLGVGGHIELNEDPNQAAIRETKEEVGLDIELVGDMPKNTRTEKYQELTPPYFLNIHQINATHQHISLAYFAKSKSDEITELTGREKSYGCKWLTKEELKNDPEISDTVKYYAAKALEVINNSI